MEPETATTEVTETAGRTTAQISLAHGWTSVLTTKAMKPETETDSETKPETKPMPINHQTQTTFAYSFQDGFPSEPAVTVPQKDFRLLERLMKLTPYATREHTYSVVNAIWPGLSPKQRAVVTDIVRQDPGLNPKPPEIRTNQPTSP